MVVVVRPRINLDLGVLATTHIKHLAFYKNNAEDFTKAAQIFSSTDYHQRQPS